MNRTLLRLLAVLGLASPLALLATGAAAQQLKPGLWEMSTKMQSSSGEMEKAMAQAQQQMANLPPAQRKMMEDMMAKQGVSMPSAGQPNTARVCMSREMVEQNGVPQQAQGDCKTTTLPRSGNTMKMSYTCSNPPSSGEGTVTFLGPEAYASKMVVNTQARGKPEQITMDSTGKWLGADCGALKPLMPKK